MSSLKSETMKTAGRVKREAKNRAQAAQEAGLQNPVRALSDAGFRSEWAYLGGFASIGLSFVGWLLSQANRNTDRAQSDRWGIFIGHWAPTFFVLGLALKHEENDRELGR
jgi:hypothetical protein